MGGTKGIGHRRLLASAQPGLGQIHPQLRNVFIETTVHIPQILQHLEIQRSQVVKILCGKVQGRNAGEAHRPGLLDTAVKGHRHRGSRQGPAGQGLICPWCRRVKVRTVQTQSLIPRGHGIEAGVAALLRQDQRAALQHRDHTAHHGVPRRFLLGQNVRLTGGSSRGRTGRQEASAGV